MQSRLRFPKSLLLLCVIAAACAPKVVAPPPVVLPPPPPAPMPVSAAELDTLGEILRLEDRREFDAQRFQIWARSPSALVRRHAALGSGRIGQKAAAPILIRLLADNDSAVRANASFALGELGDTSYTVVQALITASRAGNS